jgi:outer membrane protein
VRSANLHAIGKAAPLLLVLLALRAPAQSAPVSPDHPWHAPAGQSLEQDAARSRTPEFAPDPSTTYALAELVDLAESHNPETRVAWERARAQAAALGIARSELYPTVVATALSQTHRDQVYLNTRFYRQTAESFDLILDLNYTLFDFGARSARIHEAQAQLLASDFGFNDVHRQLIFRVAQSYYQLLNAQGQEAAARSSLANAQAVQQSAEASQANGLATLPDVLEARSATAQAEYDLQAILGAEDVAHGNLATALGASPTQPILVRSIDQVATPDSTEDTVDKAIDRAFAQRPDFMRQIAAIREADARLKEAHAAWYPTISLHARPDAQSLYASQQQLPWGHTADLDGGLTLGLNWTVFDGGLRKNQVAQAKAGVRAAQAQAEALRDQIENGIWTAYSNLKTAFRRRQAATALLEAATQSYNAALESYHYGVRNLLDVTEAQRVLAQARSADVEARTEVLTALAQLAFETGDALQPAPARPQP